MEYHLHVHGLNIQERHTHQGYVHKHLFSLTLWVIILLVILLNILVVHVSWKVDKIETHHAPDVIFNTKTRNIEINFTNPALTIAEAITKWNSVSPQAGRVLQTQRSNRGNIVIGIPVLDLASPDAISHLIKNLDSITHMSTTQQQLNNIVIIFILEDNEELVEHCFSNITHHFMYYINIGFIHIVQPPSNYVESFQKSAEILNVYELILTQNQINSMENISNLEFLTTKQAAGYIFMYDYVSRYSLGVYFLQITAHTLCSSDYLDHVSYFIELQLTPWTMLEFSDIQFLGSLFKIEGLNKWSIYLKMFYTKQPKKNLLPFFCMTSLQKLRQLREPYLFIPITTYQLISDRMGMFDDRDAWLQKVDLVPRG